MFNVLKIGQIPCIGQGIEVDDLSVRVCFDQTSNHVGTNEPSATSHQDGIKSARRLGWFERVVHGLKFALKAPVVQISCFSSKHAFYIHDDSRAIFQKTFEILFTVIRVFIMIDGRDNGVVGPLIRIGFQ